MRSMRERPLASKCDSVLGDNEDSKNSKVNSVRAEQAENTQQSKGDVQTASSMKPNVANDSGAASKRDTESESDILPVKRSQDA